MDGVDRSKQHARVEKLWKVLDTKNEGQLTIDGLRKGLNNLDHPLKNADSLLEKVMQAVDQNKDGHIEYLEFRNFVEETENHLWQLFQSIDRDHNGQLDKAELREAFERAGLHLPLSKLDQFFSEVDSNHDGVITFDEWRNFLLFIPESDPNLRAVLSYYSSTVTVNPEGDVHISDESAEGLGKITFLRNLFGGLYKIFEAPKLVTSTSPPSKCKPIAMQTDMSNEPAPSKPDTFPFDPGENHVNGQSSQSNCFAAPQHEKFKPLTDLAPHPGYFLAGGIAGAISRTATAPLDRLKVYLIAQVGVKDDALHQAKSGAPMKATKTALKPLFDATRALWRIGGIQSLFAGNGLNVLKVMPESAIKFGSYEGSKRALARIEGHNNPKGLRPWTQFIAAGLGGSISQFVIYPLDTLKFRVQNETVAGGPHGNKLIWKTARSMWTKSGIWSFYRGLPMGLLGMFPYSAIDLTTYEYTKKTLLARKARREHKNEDDLNISAFATALIGAFSGAFGASAVYPLNLLRTRLQSQGTAIHPPTYTGMWDVTKKTVQGEGVRGLFKGITPNLLKVVPAVSITYVVYDKSKQVMGLR